MTEYLRKEPSIHRDRYHFTVEPHYEKMWEITMRQGRRIIYHSVVHADNILTAMDYMLEKARGA